MIANTRIAVVLATAFFDIEKLSFNAIPSALYMPRNVFNFLLQTFSLQ